MRRCLVLLLFVLLLPGPVAALDFRVMYIDRDVTPYITGDGELVPKRPGAAVELVRRVAVELGANVRFERRPTRRVMEALRAGEADALLGRIYTPDLGRELAFPLRPDGQPDPDGSLGLLSYRFYRLPGADITWNGRQLGAAAPRPVIGLNASATMAALLQRLGADPVEVHSSPQLFGMLMARRFQAVAVLEVIGDRYAALKLERLDPPLASFDFHLPVTRVFQAAQPDFVARLWRRLGESREAVYAELLPAYLN